MQKDRHLLMIWNSLSPEGDVRRYIQAGRNQHTFDHLNIIGNEMNVVLNFKTGMPRILEDQASATYRIK